MINAVADHRWPRTGRERLPQASSTWSPSSPSRLCCSSGRSWCPCGRRVHARHDRTIRVAALEASSSGTPISPTVLRPRAAHRGLGVRARNLDDRQGLQHCGPGRRPAILRHDGRCRALVGRARL